MSATRAFGLRSTFRAACRPLRSPLLHSAGRRGYASAHGAVIKSGDMPWLIGALTVSSTGLAYLHYNRPRGTQLSHEEHLEHASEKHGVRYAKPDEEINKDEEGVPRGSTPPPTSGGQTGDDETKGPLSDKKDVSIPDAVEEDLNKDPDQIDKEMRSPDGEGKESPSDPSKTDKGSSDGEGKQKQSGSDGKEKKPSDESKTDKGSSGGEGKQKQSGSDGKEKPSNSDGGSNEMDDSSESQAKKLTDKDPSKRVDPTSK